MVTTQTSDLGVDEFLEHVIKTGGDVSIRKPNDVPPDEVDRWKVVEITRTPELPQVYYTLVYRDEELLGVRENMNQLPKRTRAISITTVDDRLVNYMFTAGRPELMRGFNGIISAESRLLRGDMLFERGGPYDDVRLLKSDNHTEALIHHMGYIKTRFLRGSKVAGMASDYVVFFVPKDEPIQVHNEYGYSIRVDNNPVELKVEDRIVTKPKLQDPNLPAECLGSNYDLHVDGNLLVATQSNPEQDLKLQSLVKINAKDISKLERMVKGDTAWLGLNQFPSPEQPMFAYPGQSQMYKSP